MEKRDRLEGLDEVTKKAARVGRLFFIKGSVLLYFITLMVEVLPSV